MVIQIKPVRREALQRLSNYIVVTSSGAEKLLDGYGRDNDVYVGPDDIFIREASTLQLSLAGLNVGIQGLGRIGKAVAQRVISMGANVLVNQRDHTRPSYQKKRRFLDRLIRTLNVGRFPRMNLLAFVEQDDVVESSNILTTLTPLTDETRVWIDEGRLKQFGVDAKGPIRAIVSQVKNLIDESALLEYLKNRADVEVRLDVVNQEERGDAHLRFRDDRGEPLTNIKIAGHTAAAVPEVRRLKVQRALENLEQLMDDKIPSNVLNRDLFQPEEENVELAGLKFRRMRVNRPKANVLVVEPLNSDILAAVHDQFPDVNFDVIQSESEIIERDGRLIAGIDPNIDQIVRENEYDFCVGYCNTKFDNDFFEGASLKGLVLFATAEHHIDLDAATEHNTLVTTAPGPTTTAVAEQNIGLALDGIYGASITDQPSDDLTRLADVAIDNKSKQAAVSQIMWYSLLKEVLKLDEMFEFGRSGRYAKTGVSVDSTVYHDQIGQNHEAGVVTSIGIAGLDQTGVDLLEFAIAHEVAKIYVLRDEFDELDQDVKDRIVDLVSIVETNALDRDVAIDVVFVDDFESMEYADYILKTPENTRPLQDLLNGVQDSIVVDANEIFIVNPQILEQSLQGLNVGVHGIRRIGTAVAQRVLAMGANLIVDTDSLDARDIEAKRAGFKELVSNRRRQAGVDQRMPAYVSKEDFMRQSNIVTMLGNSSEDINFHWIDADALRQFGLDAQNPLRVVINVSKYQADEQAIHDYALENPHVQIRLDVLSDETVGEGQDMFVDEEGKELINIKLSGHTAAAVWAVRRLKISRALNNLRGLIDGHMPSHILNPDVLNSLREDTPDTPDDKAMVSDNENVGGINLDPALLDLQIKRDDSGIPLPLKQQSFDSMHIQGYFPVIINVQPIINLPLFLGQSDYFSNPQVSRPDISELQVQDDLSKSSNHDSIFDLSLYSRL